jgi:ABC-type Fe3+ transport system permease subunit
MRQKFYQLMTMVVTGVLLLPGWVFAAGGGGASKIVVVADTRRVSGVMRYFSDMYNNDILMYAIWSVVMTAAMGCFLGFLMDFIMARTGLDLKSRKIVEH